MAPDPIVSGAPIVEEYRQPYHEYVAPDPTVSGAPIVEEYRQPYHEYVAPDPTVSGAPIVEEYRQPYHEYVAPDPTVEEMRKVVVVDRCRPAISRHWGSDEVSFFLIGRFASHDPEFWLRNMFIVGILSLLF